MSATIHPVSRRRGLARVAPAEAGRRRRKSILRHWDDRLVVERNTSASDLALRSVGKVKGLHR